MELSPRLYHYFVRPRLFSKIYIDNVISQSFALKDKTILDFGSGTGSGSFMSDPDRYLGVDIDPARVHYARRLYPGYRFDILEDNRLPVDDNYIDCILIVAVLHHISDEGLPGYLQEFHRVLKPHGKILVLEPCYCDKSRLNNRFMTFFDQGRFIRFADEYLDLFNRQMFRTKIIQRFKKLFYNEIFFLASP